MNISAAKVHQSTLGPFYNHTESATGLQHSPGHFDVVDLDVQANIPFPVLGIPLLHWEFGAQAIHGDSQGEANLTTLTK